MKHSQTPAAVKSCTDSLEVSPSKNASNSKPVYSKVSKKGNGGGKGGFKR